MAMRHWATGTSIRILALTALLAGGLVPAGAAVLGEDALGAVDFEAVAADGTALRGVVHLPAGDGPLGTVLELSPYWNTVKGPAEAQGTSEAVKPFLDAGFAVALVNLRGTGRSDGCFQWGSRVDWADASTVVETLARQPWSNGNVGMYGTSYEGWSQFMAMADPPAALKAAVPISGVIDLWSLLTRQGAPIAIGPTASTEFGFLTSFVDPDPAVIAHLRCTDYGEHLARGLDLVDTGDRTDYYADRDLRAAVAGSPVPVLLANGLRFLEEGHELQFEGLWDALAPDRTRFMLGQWGHGGKRADFNALAVGWFDHYLRGGPATTEAGVVEYQDDVLRWHRSPRWPPPARRQLLALSGEDLTDGATAAVPSRRSFLSTDIDTLTDTADSTLENAAGLGVGPACGPHQVIYVSPPVAEDILVAGNFTARLTLSSTLPGGNLVATLYHSAGDGSCAEGLRGAEDSGRIELDLRHAGTSGASAPFPVGDLVEVTAESLPLATVVPAGHRLVLAVGAGSAELLGDPAKPRVTIATGDGLAASLSLPVVDGNLRFR